MAQLDCWEAWGAPGEHPLERASAAGEAQKALGDLRRMLKELCRLYGIALTPMQGPPLPLAALKEDAPRNWRPVSVSVGALPCAASADLEYFLHLLFGKSAFKPGQREAVLRLLRGEDAWVLLPTGGGKSLIYQLAGLLRPGVCVVVEPTIALMEDQLAGLARAGITRAEALSSAVSEPEERLKMLRSLARGDCAFFYVAPERFQSSSFRRALAAASAGPGIALCAIDEAHCLSEWGHDFRTAYLRLGEGLLRMGRPPTAALSATASSRVQEDVVRHLGLRASSGLRVRGPGPARKELRLHVRRCEEREKHLLLRSLLMDERGGAVFCPHAEGPHGVRSIAAYLRATGLPADVYHGRPPRGIEAEVWRAQRSRAALRFSLAPVPLLAATKAFGLGVDRADLRRTVHYGLPASIEAFWQEAGRAGRDGRCADCWVLFSVMDLRRARRLLDARTPHEEILRELRGSSSANDDDVLRMLRMHVSGFRGMEQELMDIGEIIGRLGALDRPGPRELLLPGQPPALVERALYALLRAGALLDYCSCREPGTFRAALSGRGACEEELRRIVSERYRVIEPERRAALLELLEACLLEDGAALAAAAVRRFQEGNSASESKPESEAQDSRRSKKFGELVFSFAESICSRRVGGQPRS